MPRPTEPLLSRAQVDQVVLDLIRRDGVAALSMRRVAAELAVNPSSIYHYFRGKDEMLTSAARAAIGRVRVPRRSDFPDVRDWLVAGIMRYHRFFVDNPYVIPLLTGGFVPPEANRTYRSVFHEATGGTLGPEQERLLRQAMDAVTIGLAVVDAGEAGRSSRRTRAERDADVERIIRAVLAGFVDG